MVTWRRKIFQQQEAQLEDDSQRPSWRRRRRSSIFSLRSFCHLLALQTFYLYRVKWKFMCAAERSFKRCNEASQHGQTKKAENFCSLTSFLCCGRVIYARWYFISLLMCKNEQTSVRWLRSSSLFWSLQLFILIPQCQQKRAEQHISILLLTHRHHADLLFATTVSAQWIQCTSNVLTPTFFFPSFPSI